MKLYRYITGPDDSAFCHRITDLLNRGWSLQGDPTLTYDAEARRVICGQAVVKEVEGTYAPDIELSKF